MLISSPPLVFDFDNSVAPLNINETRMQFEQWQETLRFSCSWRDFHRFERSLSWPPHVGCLFLGSGDYHHISLLSLKRLANEKEPLEVVVCDNHPDNMRYPFGVHCGSWVNWAASLPGVSKVHVLGITSSDVSWSHAWENHLRPLLSGRLTYWCIGRGAPWLKLFGNRRRCRSFDTADDLLNDFVKEIQGEGRIYLSVDKDVFSSQTVKTNWDQGVWEKRHLEVLISSLSGRLAGADVTGEVSDYAYQGLFKKILTRLDGLERPNPSDIESWQAEQQKFNMEILAMLQKAGH